ncbi:MAG: phenylalanine--tRNA ligase subunit beta [Cyclobacteriaceae bacterium]
MKISYNWLKQYIEITEGPEDLGKILTGTGLEVESIEAVESVPGGLKGLVIGEVLTCTKHPNADKLSLTTVDVGQGEPLPIVCGAPNVAAGQKVVVAKPGTTIYPTSGEPFTIKKAKIRGEVSQGMICAEDEVGLGTGHEGIMVLNTKAANGTLASDYFKIESDHIFEIGLTPNRADAASHVGTARDIKAVKGGTLRLPSVAEFKTDNTSLTIPVTVENTEACPRYSAVTISGVKVTESPAWLKNRLTSIGLTPINNVVDITNFVCHELGQPLHAFNADAIKGKKVIVKTVPAGTRFVTLDEKERKLTDKDLMICDEEGGMCIAGVFGGIHSGIDNNTTRIFLESAHFSADYIRRTGMHHQLKTDASFRFERGVDPELTVYALKRAALLIKEIAGGVISSEIVDVYPKKIERKVIDVKDSHVNRLIGKVIPRERMFEILQLLDFEILEKQAGQFKVSVPTYRVEVLQEADVIEEILRIYGFNNVELSDIVGTSYLADFPEKDINRFRNSIGDLLVSNGFYEILTNSLTHQAFYDKYPFTLRGEIVQMQNPLSEELNVLRQTLLFNGLQVLEHNINRQQRNLKLYEFGKVYWKDGREYREEERLGLFLTGQFEPENWRSTPRTVDFFDLAQFAQLLFNKCNVNSVSQQVIEHPLFDYGVKWTAGKTDLGVGGKLKSALAKDFGLKQEIFYADLEAILLFNAASPKLVIQDVPKYPEVRRDLSLVLDKTVTFAEIQDLVRATEKRLIKDILAFDVYEGKNIPEGKKAYALGFILQDETKTLTDEEIDKTMNLLMGAFEKKMGAFIRK